MNNTMAILLGAGLTLPALAAEPPPALQVEITPYAWLAGVEGDVKVNGREADFDKSFSDIFDMVELGGSLLGIVQYDRFVLWGQVDYFSMSTDQLDVDEQPKAGTLDSTMLLGELAAGYQVDGWMEGQTFDILAGVRTLSIENELDLYNGVSADNDQDLLDPILVVRPSIPLFPSRIDGLRFNPTLAIGGGGDSELVYEMQPQIQWQVTENVAARIGYRRVGYKVEGDGDKDNELNFSLSGLIVGAGIRF